MSGTVNPFAQFVPGAPPSAPAAPAVNPFAQFTVPPPVQPPAVAPDPNYPMQVDPNAIDITPSGQAPATALPQSSVGTPTPQNTYTPPPPAGAPVAPPAAVPPPVSQPQGQAVASLAPLPAPPPAAAPPPPMAAPKKYPGPEDGLPPEPAPSPVGPISPSGETLPPPAATPPSQPLFQPPASAAVSRFPQALGALQGVQGGAGHPLPTATDAFIPEGVNQLGEALTQGVAQGWAPEAAAAINAAVPSIGGSQAPSFSQRYAENLKAARSKYAAVPANVRAIGETAGAIPTLALGGGLAAAGGRALGAVNSLQKLAGPVARFAATTPGKIALAGAAGGASGEVQGAGQAGPGERSAGALTGGILGAALGAGVPALGHGLQGLAHAGFDYLQPAFQRAARPVLDEAGVPLTVTGPSGEQVPLRANPATQRQAGKILAGAPDQQAALAGAANDQGLSAGQASGHHELLKLETGLSESPDTNPLFVQMRERQAASNEAALQGAGGGGDVEGALQTFRAMREAQETTAAEAQTRGRGVTGAAQAVGGNTPRAEAQGDLLRAAPSAWEDAQRAQADQLYSAVDPDGKLVMDARPLLQARKELLSGLTNVEKSRLTPEEKSLFELPLAPSSKFRELAAYNSAIAEDIRSLRLARNDAAAARLGRLKAAAENAMDASLVRTMERDPTIAQRIEETANGATSEAGASQGGNIGLPAEQSAGGPGENTPVSGTRRANPAGRGVAAGNRNVPSGLSASARSYPSLLSFLRRGGGVQDHAGELASIFDTSRAARGLVRREGTGGQSLDYAREAAVQAGYLPQNADINDLLDAIAKEHGGDKVYPQASAGDRGAQALDDAAQSRREGYAAGAREAVHIAREDLGDVNLTPDEIEQATDLVIGGAHPEDAVREVASNTEADTAAAQPPPVEQTRRYPQAEEGLPESSPEEIAGAMDRRKEANAFYRNFKATTDNPIGDALFREGKTAGQYITSNASLPAKVLAAGPKGAEAMTQYLAQGGSAEAADEVMASMARQAALRDGSVDLPKLESFVQKYRETLNHPALKGLASRLTTAARAEAEFARVAAVQAEHLKRFNQSAVNRFVGAGGTQDAARIMGGVINAKDSTALMKSLLAQAPASVRDGLKQMLADDIMSRTISTQHAGSSVYHIIKKDGLQRLLRDKRQTLEQLFSPEEMANLERLGNVLDKQSRSGALKTPGHSQTNLVSNLTQAIAGKGATFLDALKAVATPAVFLGVGVHSGHTVAGLALTAIQQALHQAHLGGLRDVNMLVAHGLITPKVGHILASRATLKNAPYLAGALNKALRASLAAQGAKVGNQELGGRDYH